MIKIGKVKTSIKVLVSFLIRGVAQLSVLAKLVNSGFQPIFLDFLKIDGGQNSL